MGFLDENPKEYFGMKKRTFFRTLLNKGKNCRVFEKMTGLKTNCPVSVYLKRALEIN